MIEDINSIFEDPVEEEIVTLPNSELEQTDVETIDNNEEDVEVKEADLNTLFGEVVNAESTSEEFLDPLRGLAAFNSLEFEGPGGAKMNWGDVKLKQLYNTTTGLFNVDNFSNDAAKSTAVVFNNRILSEKEEYNNKLAPYTKISKPGVSTSFDSLDTNQVYKWEIGEEGKLEYYYKDNEDDEDWVRQENEKGSIYIQTHFEHNDADIEKLDEYYLNQELYNKQQAFRDQLFNVDTANEKAVQAINDKLLNATDLSELKNTELNDDVLNKMNYAALVGTEDTIYIPQGGSITSEEWEYNGNDLDEDKLEDIGYDPNDSLKIFEEIYQNSSDTQVSLQEMGLNFNSFLGWVENSGNIKGGLDGLLDTYYRAENYTEENSRAKNESFLSDALNTYKDEEVAINKQFLITNFFKNKLNDPEYIKLIKEINNKLKDGDMSVLSYEDDKLDLLNWTNSQELINKVLKDMTSESGFDNAEELMTYIDNFTIIRQESWNKYLEESFPTYYNFSKDQAIKNRDKYVSNIENKGKDLNGFFSEFGGGMLNRLQGWIQGASQNLSGASGWLGWQGGKDLFDQRENIFNSMVTEEIEGMSNIRTPGFYSGKTVEYKGVNYILTEDDTIYNSDSHLRYVPAATIEGSEEAQELMRLLNESNETDTALSADDGRVAMGAVSGFLFWDIGATLLQRNLAGRAGLTKRYKNFLKTKFKLNTKTVNLVSNTTNTMAYYGMSGTMDGYINTYKMAIAENMSHEDAHNMAQGAAWRQGAWYAATSLFVPQSLYNKIPLRVGGFKNKTKAAIEAYKKGGNKGFNNYWRTTFSSMSPTSRGVINKLYNFGAAGFGESAQELGQEFGTKKWINKYVNDTAGKRIASEDFTFDEIVNTGIYSFIAGGTAGQLGGGATINTNTKQYVENLIFLGKDSSKLESLLNKMVLNGDLTGSVSKNLLADTKAVTNQVFKMPTWVKDQNVLEAAQIMQKIEDLNIQKKEFGGNFKGFDNQIKDLQVDLNLLYASDLDIGNQKIADQIGYEYFNGNTAEIEAEISRLKALDPNANVDNSIGFGAFVTANGKQYALIDTVKSAKKSFFTTGQHEGFHGLLAALVRRDPTAGGRLGSALLKELRKGINKGDIVLNNNELGVRLQQYVNDNKISDNVVLEEIMPLLSEALTRGGVTINETTGSKIGDALRRFMSSLGVNIGFKSGKDVLNLVRDYNKAVQSGRGLSRGLQNVAKDKGSFGIGETNISLDNDAVLIDEQGNQVNRTGDQDIRESKDLETLIADFKAGDTNVDVESLTKQYQNLGRDAIKRWAAARGVTINLGNPQIAEEVTSLLNKEFNSFMKNFDPSKASVSTYMNNIAKRIGPVLVEEGTRRGKQVSQDVLSEKGVSLETSEQPDIDKKSEPSGARAKVFPNSVKVIADSVTGEVRAEQIVLLKNDITEAILRVGTNPKDVAKFVVEKTKSKEYRAILKKALGSFGSEQYIDNVNKLFNNNQFIKSIPVANIKRRFGKLFGIKQTGVTPTIKIENGKRTDFNKQVYSIPAITDNKLIKVKQYFLAGEKRHQSLMSLIGEGIAVEAINEIANDKEFMDNLQNRLEFRDSDLTAIQFMNELEFNLDKRNLETKSLDNVKLSKDTEPLTISDFQRIGLIIENNPKALLRQKGYKTYPSTKANWSDSFSAEQKKQRNDTVIRMLPKLGLDYFNSYAWFKHSKSIFKDSADFKNEIFDKALDVDFVKNNKAFIEKYAIKKGNQYFLNKNSLPKQGPALTNTEWKVLKKARTEQATYAKMTPSKRIDELKDPNFRKLQENKTKVLEKIVKTIDSDIRDSNKNIIPERLEFWAAWMESQNNVPSHDFRVLAPIKFFSLSTIPFTTPVLKVRNKDNTITEGALKNYEAEHMLPVNNATRAILNMVIDGNIDKDFQFIKDNYVQGQLLKADDNIITKAGYQTRLPRDFFNMEKPNSWVRYLLGNPKIDLNSYVTFKDGKVMTVAESLGLPLLKIDQNPDSINAQNELLIEVLKGDKTIESAKAELKSSDKVDKSSSKQVIINQRTLFPLINSKGDTDSSIKAMEDADKTSSLANRYSKEPKGISVFDFDDTLAFSESKIIVKSADGKITKITPEQFANQAEELLQNGAVFDFTEFNKVVNGKKGPLADLALKRQKKFGSGDIFVLTARPQLSASSIKMFLDGIGLNIPIENITGLENGSPEAKALWILDKTAKGYNDFYFADDVLANVQAVKNILDQVDVKSKVQQAKASKEVDLDKEFNVIIEQQSGKEWFKNYSDARSQVEGKKANKFDFFIPPSAEDFLGLMYKIIPKGKNGDRAMRWIKDNLLDPFNSAEQQVISAKIKAANDFNSLKESIDNIPSNLQKPSGYSNYTFSQALRVYIWNMQDNDIPGLSIRDKNKLVSLVADNTDLKVFAEKIAFIQQGKTYPGPQNNWVGGSITSDIINSIQKTFRKETLQQWQQNVDIIFAKKNLNKLEALYGSNYVIALKDILGRMKRGSNRPLSENAQVNNTLDWINNSVGTIMFLNRKSALLQLISSVNFINWNDNNILAASKAFANQPQYWKDVMMLMNSDYLVQRRNGMRINVAESEIADASKNGGMKGVIAYMLNKGFVFTRIADSLAIATGGASFYRNRLNKLKTIINPDTGKVYTKKEAEVKSFDDFYQISEESQQSSRTDRISMQQSSSLGRIVLNFANTPMQYARIIKKSTADLLAGRGDWKTNLSKIAYYGAVQNLIFNALQSAVFTFIFDEEEDKEKRSVEDKAYNIGFGMLSSLLRGLGYGGALVDTIISVGREINTQSEKKSPDYEEAVWNIFDFSPSIDSKVRKLRSAANTFKYNRDEIKRRGFSLENPKYLALAQVVSATVNVPADRILRMAMTLKQASDRDTALWQRVMLLVGYSSWQSGLPYWGTKTTIENEANEDAEIKKQYDNDARKLKANGYKRVPMTRGKPPGKLMEDYIQVSRPNGKKEYWIVPKMKIK